MILIAAKEMGKDMPQNQMELIARLQRELPEMDRQSRKALDVLLEEISAQRRRKSLLDLMSEKHPILPLTERPESPVVACQGTMGAYSHLAALRMFPSPEIRFLPSFEDVFLAVEAGETQFGLLPIENSSAGAVTQVYELVPSHSFYITYSYALKVEHCLAAKAGTRPEEIRLVISHPQALMQCSRFFRETGLSKREEINTAVAAQKVSESLEPIACICSRESAVLYGLEALRENIQNSDSNYTRWACISKANYVPPEADTVAIAVQAPHEAGSLNRLLTRFSLCDLNLSRILSMPLGKKDFSVLFHLEFRGNSKDKRVSGLLNSLYEEYQYFQYYGNYQELD